MTIRSSEHHHSKTSTISRRHRNRNQNLSYRPPELDRAKTPASNRAATSSPPRHISVNLQDSQTLAPDSYESLRRGNSTLGPSQVQNTTENTPHLPTFEFSTFEPLKQPTPEIQAAPQQPAAPQFQALSLSAGPSPSSPPLSDRRQALDFQLPLLIGLDEPCEPAVNVQDMSTFDYMVPAHYGAMNPMNPYGSSQHNLHNYSGMDQQSQPPSSGSYAPAYSDVTSPNQRPILPAYHLSPGPQSPYHQSAGSIRGSTSPMAYPPASSEPSMSPSPHYGYSMIQPHQPLTPLPSNATTYSPPALYPPRTYEMSSYNPIPPALHPPATSPTYTSYEHPQNIAPAPGSSVASSSTAMQPRVLNTKPKPQCWEHGCNGRQFSTFSNLLRHQREKSGTAAKSYCPRCGAEFTRTTARNGHMAHEKCKPRRSSESGK